LRLTASGGRIEASAWGEGAEWLMEAAPGLIGADDNPGEFEPPPGLIRTLH
jgi:hypothetical protein